MKTVAIVPSAGRGKRLGSIYKKPFVPLNGLPIASYALRTLDSSALIDGIIIAAERSSVKKIKYLVKRFALKKVIQVVVGGNSRFESVRNCLDRVDPSFDMVLIHDAARPFLDGSMIRESIKAAEKFGGCIVAVPESDTVKLADKRLFIKKTLDRDRIFRAQTPQVFRRELIKKAYAVKGSHKTTDDAAMVEILGGKVRILEGSYRNIKITTKEDLKLAEVLLRPSTVRLR